MDVDRPRSMSAYRINSSMGDSLGYKSEVERLIRESELEYVIVRPDRLIGS